MTFCLPINWYVQVNCQEFFSGDRPTLGHILSSGHSVQLGRYVQDRPNYEPVVQV
jgi:hypothetical protein